MSLKFVGIGFPKCGTTFLYNKLMEHPELENGKKERHFFSKPFHKFSTEEYKEYREKFKGDKLFGEFSPGILYYPLNIKFLTNAVDSKTKFIVVIRNPIDRAHSHFKQLKDTRMGIVKPDNKEHFIELSAYPEALYSGLYFFALQQLFKYVPKERVIMIQYEKLLKNFYREIGKIFDFLELSPYNLIDDDTRPSTKYRDFREELKEFYEDDVDGLFKKYGKINDYSLISKKHWEDF